MPRRRQGGGFRKRKFIRKDWVYTRQGYLGGVFSQSAGIANGIAQPLVFATGAERVAVMGRDDALPTVTETQGGYARPETRPNVVYAVQGHLVMSPSAWALGNEFLWGWRLMIYNMDSITGGIEIDLDYSMWQNEAVAPIHDMRYYANSSNVLAEGRIYRSFGENTSNGSWRADIRWSSRQGRRLEEDEGLFL